MLPPLRNRQQQKLYLLRHPGPRFFQNISPKSKCVSAPPIILPRHSVKKVNGMLPFQCFGASVDGSIVGDLRWELPAEKTG